MFQLAPRSHVRVPLFAIQPSTLEEAINLNYPAERRACLPSRRVNGVGTYLAREKKKGSLTDVVLFVNSPVKAHSRFTGRSQDRKVCGVAGLVYSSERSQDSRL
jgi:hypothetical protein